MIGLGLSRTVSEINGNFGDKSQNYHTPRGHCAKLYKSRIMSVRDGNFFSNRIINTWNSLPDAIVSSRSVDIFKRKLHSMSFSLD